MSTFYDYDWILNPKQNAMFKHELEMGTDTLPGRNPNYTGDPVYTVNRWGCRVPNTDRDWSIIDPESCVVIVGCSQTWGIGLEYRQTVAQHLEDALGITVLNLALPAASPSWIGAQCLELLSRYKPVALGVIWSDPMRYHDWHTKAPLGLWDKDELWNQLMRREQHLYTLAARNRLMVNALCQTMGVPLAEMSWSPWWTDRLPRVLAHSAPDRARDGQHWGPQSAQIAAKILKEQIDAHTTSV